MKRLAITIEGRLDYCEANDYCIQLGNCRLHILHQENNETVEEFVERVINGPKQEDQTGGKYKTNIQNYLKNKKLKTSSLSGNLTIKDEIIEKAVKEAVAIFESEIKTFNDSIISFVPIYRKEIEDVARTAAEEEANKFQDFLGEVHYSIKEKAKEAVKNTIENSYIYIGLKDGTIKKVLRYKIFNGDFSDILCIRNYGEDISDFEERAKQKSKDHDLRQNKFEIYSLSDYEELEDIISGDIPVSSINKEILSKYGIEKERPSILDFKEYAINNNIGLEIFANDPDENVRALVARKRYDLGCFLLDPSPIVRIEVAKQGYGLDILIDDDYDLVRAAVAEQGYGLSRLINDKSRTVKLVASSSLMVNSYKNTKQIPDKELKDDIYNEQNLPFRIQLAKKGFLLFLYINDPNWEVRKAVASCKYGLDILYQDPNSKVREEVARQGGHLDVLYKDKDPNVRAAVAEQGCYISKLETDSNEIVQNAVQIWKENVSFT